MLAHCRHKPERGIDLNAIHNSTRDVSPQSQRDCDFQPRVARNELPWGSRPNDINPNGVVSASCPNLGDYCGRNPVGVVDWSDDFPG